MGGPSFGETGTFSLGWIGKGAAACILCGGDARIRLGIDTVARVVRAGVAYMIAQAGAVQQLRAFFLLRRSAARLAISSCWQSIARDAARHCNVALPLTLAASALTWALANSAILDRSKTKP